MPRKRRTILGRHTPVQRRCRRMRAYVPPLGQVDVRALQQFIVDAYAKIESERLQFLRREQDHLRADGYKDLRETIVNQDGDPRNVGQKVILPVSFCGGPCYMFERQQDDMAYVRKFDRQDLFITGTTNPKWPGILESLTPGHQPRDRPDLLVRAFCLKIQNLLKILRDGCFGYLETPILNFKIVVYCMHIFFFGHHMMPHSIYVIIFTNLFAYTVPKPKLYLYNFKPLYFRRLTQKPSEAGHLSLYIIKGKHLNSWTRQTIRSRIRKGYLLVTNIYPKKLKHSNSYSTSCEGLVVDNNLALEPRRSQHKNDGDLT